MSEHKTEDYLQECIESVNEDLSVEAFQKACCSICMNSECKRSNWGESNWLQRMKRQENNIYNPTFYDPGEYEELANQDFITIDDDQSKVYGGWVDIKEDGTVVHHGEEETKEREADKIDESVQSLQTDEPENTTETVKTKGVEEVETPDEEVSDAQNSEDGETTTDEKQTEESDPGGPEQNPDHIETKPVQPKHFTDKNTEAPDDGIMLGNDGDGSDGGPPKDARREESELIKQSRKWEVSEADKKGNDGDSGGNLTVRIDSGEVVDND